MHQAIYSAEYQQNNKMWHCDNNKKKTISWGIRSHLIQASHFIIKEIGVQRSYMVFSMVHTSSDRMKTQN